MKKNRRNLGGSLLILFLIILTLPLKCYSYTELTDEKDDVYIFDSPYYTLEDNFEESNKGDNKDNLGIVDIKNIEQNFTINYVKLKINFYKFDISLAEEDQSKFGLFVNLNGSYYENARIEFFNEEGYISSQIKYKEGIITQEYTILNDSISFNVSRGYYGDSIDLEVFFTTINKTNYEFTTLIDIYPNTQDQESSDQSGSDDLMNTMIWVLIYSIIGFIVGAIVFTIIKNRI